MKIKDMADAPKTNPIRTQYEPNFYPERVSRVEWTNPIFQSHTDEIPRLPRGNRKNLLPIEFMRNSRIIISRCMCDKPFVFVKL